MLWMLMNWLHYWRGFTDALKILRFGWRELPGQLASFALVQSGEEIRSLSYGISVFSEPWKP